MNFQELADEWHEDEQARIAASVGPSERIPSEHEGEFLHYLRMYANHRARLVDEGKECELALLDFENWLDPKYGAVCFHFGMRC